MKDSYVFHTANREYLRLLPPEQQLLIYDFLSDFTEADGNIALPEVDKTAYIVLKMITDRMMEEFRRYEETRAKRAEGGKLGGRPRKPKGLEENQKVLEEPQGYLENLSKAKKAKEPVYVFGVESEIGSDSVNGVCNAVGVQREGAGTPTKEQVDEYYSEVCRKHGKAPRQGFTDRFMQYSHRDWQHDVEKWVQDDIRRGVHDKPKEQRTAGKFCNYKQSDTDWETAFDKLIAAQEQKRKQEQEVLDFE